MRPFERAASAPSASCPVTCRERRRACHRGSCARPEARTSSRRSMMTDDSRPNHATWSAVRCSDSPKSFCTGKRRPRQNDVLEIGTYQTRPARHGSKHKITVRGSESRLSERLMRMFVGSAGAARWRGAGRVCGRPSGHDRVHRGAPDVVLWKMHVASKEESAHATVDQAMVRARASGAFEWIRLDRLRP